MTCVFGKHPFLVNTRQTQDNQYEMGEKWSGLKDALKIEEHVLGCMCDSSA